MQKLIYIMLLVLVLGAVSVAASELEIDKVEITRDGDRFLSTSSSSGSFDVDPGDTLRVKIWLENRYDDDTDNDIEDVRVVGVIEDIDDGDDEDDSETVDVRADSRKTVTLRFDIPNDASSYESYDLDIEACGDDQNGTEHCDSADYDIEVDREEHELVFDTLQVSDAYCDGEVNFRVELENIGEDDEYDVELKVYHNDLGVLFKDEFDLPSLESDEDNFYSKSKRFDVDSLPSGRHTLTVVVRFDHGRQDMERNIEFRVDECGRAADDQHVLDASDQYEEKSVERYSNPNRDTRWLFGEDQPIVVDMPPANVPVPSPPRFPGEKDDGFGIFVLALGNIAILIFIFLLLRSHYGW